MFTGIIENRGMVKEKKAKGGLIRFTFELKKAFKNLKLGESIAVNGTCLTVAEKTARSFSADVISETLKATTLGSLKVGSVVNLERALRYKGSVGGHFITGHVDGVGKIKKIKREGDNQVWTVSVPQKLTAYIALKGSVALDGISLTVQDVKKSTFKIGLIPHTLKETTLASKKTGDALNVEVDLLARYAAKLLKSGKLNKKPSDEKLLKTLLKQGF